MWRGEDQGEVEWWIMPAFSMAENSALATESLSGSRQKRGSRVSEEIVVNLVVRRQSCKTIGGEDIRKLREEVKDALWDEKEVGTERGGWWR